MHLLQTVIFTLSRLAGGLAGLLLVAMVLHILLEIVLRAFFSTSTFVLDEFVGYGVAAITFLSLGYTLEHGALIRVNLVLGRTHGRARRALEVLAAGLTLGLLTFLGWFFWFRVARHVSRGTVSNTIAQVPMWIPEGLVLLGLGLFWLQMFAYLLRMLFAPYAEVKPLAQPGDDPVQSHE